MNHEHIPAQPHHPVSLTPLTRVCGKTTQTRRRARRRLASGPAVAPAASAPSDDESAPLRLPRSRRLVLVQEGKAICVVERHRHHSALSVARLLCRLRLSDAWVYACPSAEADRLLPEQRLENVPEHWQELYRATPCAEPTTTDAVSLPVVGIR